MVERYSAEKGEGRMLIVVDDLHGAAIADLLNVHLELMRSTSPPESVHALDLDALRVPEITFWSARDGGVTMGCVALKELDARHGEIKSMHVRRVVRGGGLAQELLDTLEAEARQRGYERLSLETGAVEAFAPARRLYERNGYAPCPPFGSYFEDPFSVCMTKLL